MRAAGSASEFRSTANDLSLHSLTCPTHQRAAASTAESAVKVPQLEEVQLALQPDLLLKGRWIANALLAHPHRDRRGTRPSIARPAHPPFQSLAADLLCPLQLQSILPMHQTRRHPPMQLLPQQQPALTDRQSACSQPEAATRRRAPHVLQPIGLLKLPSFGILAHSFCRVGCSRNQAGLGLLSGAGCSP